MLEVIRLVFEPLDLDTVLIVLPLFVIVLVDVVLDPLPVDLVVLLVYTIIYHVF